MIGSHSLGANSGSRYTGTDTTRAIFRCSSLRTALALTLDWGVIAAAVTASAWTGSTWVYCLSVLVVSRQMNALFELHHQAIHGNLFRKREWNERLDWLYSIPLFTRVSEDRDAHMEHHRTFRVENGDYRTWGTGYGLDPSLRTDRVYMVWFLLGRPFAAPLQVGALLDIIRNPGWKKPRFLRAALIYWAAVLSAFAVMGRLEWIFWYWLVPYFTLYQVLFFWDDMIGHYNCPKTGTREMRGLWFSFLAAHGTAYHNVHHLCPGIPWFRQADATAHFVDESSVDVARGFRDAIRQMVTACE